MYGAGHVTLSSSTLELRKNTMEEKVVFKITRTGCEELIL